MDSDQINSVQNWIPEISSEPVQRFLREHENEDQARLLVLKNKTVFGMPTKILADQVLVRIKAKTKLPGFYAQDGIVFPEAINLEQCSSEITAGFKQSFLQKEVANKNILVDLTGGFGVDSKFFCLLFDQVVSVDPDIQLNEIVRHNFASMGISNFRRLDLTSEVFLDQNTKPVSCFYVDPSRRRDQKKIVSLKKCLPDITTLQDKIFQQSPFLLIKASPLLDISQGLSELHHVRKVVVLSVANECKELLFFCDRDYESTPHIVALDLKGDISEEFCFTQGEESSAKVPLGDIDNYLYEANTSILKAGAFKLVGARFNLSKLSKNTHFYTSREYCAIFPGRIFEVIKLIKSDVGEVTGQFPERKANIISRNYPLTVDELKKKLKLTEGGEKFLIATSAQDRKVLIVANRLK